MRRAEQLLETGRICWRKETSTSSASEHYPCGGAYAAGNVIHGNSVKLLFFSIQDGWETVRTVHDFVDPPMMRLHPRHHTDLTIFSHLFTCFLQFAEVTILLEQREVWRERSCERDEYLG
jgi:hypothetical protein